MTVNPFRPPGDDAGSAGAYSTPQVDPATAANIKARIETLNTASLILILFCLRFELSGPGIFTIAPVEAFVVEALGKVLWICGLGCYARMRGRSWLWGIFGSMSCVGYVALAAILGKRCHLCRAPTTGPTCSRCGAPAPR